MTVCIAHVRISIYVLDGRLIVRNGGHRGGIMAVNHGVVVSSLQTRTSSDHDCKLKKKNMKVIINFTFQRINNKASVSKNW